MAILKPRRASRERLVLLCAVVCCLLAARGGEAVLTLQQGRVVTTPQFNVDLIDIVGIATVELGGNEASRPSYFFDCITNLNNGSGITWTRMSTQNTFQVKDIPGGSQGRRLDTPDIDYMHLDIYTCMDQYSGESVSVNITGSNPAIMAAEESVSVVQGLAVELEVYVSGYPVPTESSIEWRRPDGTVIQNTDFGVAFQGGGRRIILSSVESAQAGSYSCSVTISFSPYMAAFTSIQLDVYVPTTIVIEPALTTVVEEWNKATLNCSARGVPIPLVTWEREDGGPLPTGAQITTSMISTTTSSGLVLNMTRYGDRGRYRCVAANGQTNAVMSQYADLQVTPALRVVDGGMQEVSDIYSVQNGASVNLECFGTGTLQWTSSTGLEIPTDSTANIYQSFDESSDASALTIKSFSSDVTATYTCTTDLTVNGPITSSVLITSSNPAVVIRSSVQYVLRGTTASLEARVFASPLNSATIAWYHQGSLIDVANDARYSTSSNGDIYSLTVSSVSEAEVGEYTIVVSLNGVTANDTIRLAFPVVPSATVTPSTVSVNEGEAVRLVCEVTGSRPLTVSWTLSDGSPLPLGVQENGNELEIAAAASSHPGTYVCSVSNLAGNSQAEATITVYYSPEVTIVFDGTPSPPNEPIYLVRNDGDQGPTVTCSASGNPTPTLRWTQENGRGLPSGIVQTSQPSGELELRWQRPMEFTDSGSYICQASNNIGNGSRSTATLDVLVQIEPEISSLYPFSSDIMQGSQTFSYVVPLGYEGIALVCAATGWPAPEVEWQKDGQPLLSSSGIVSESSTMAATVSARLRWSREVHNSDAGSYECVVRKPNTVVPVDSRSVQLNVGPSSITGAPLDCSIDQTSVYFQIRILGTDCTSWEGALSSQIAADFRDEILSVVRTECSCVVDESDLEVLGSPQCSSEVEGAAVFRGKIQTTSQRRTELAYCSLLSWQQRSPLIRINEQFRAVDSGCSLQASGSLDGQECAAPGGGSEFGMLEIAYVIGAAALALVILVLVLLICVVACYCYQRSGRKEINFAEAADHTYARTDSFKKYGSEQPSSRTGPGGEEPVYSTLTRETTGDSPQRSESISLSLIRHQSSQKLISESTDGRNQSQHQRPPPLATTTESYLIPVNSQENISSQTPGSVSHFTAAQRHAGSSSSSAYNTTSHARISPVQRTRPSVSPVDDGGNNVVSASSPFNDYEHIDGDERFSQSSSFCESPTAPANLPARQKGSFKLRQSPISPRQFEIGGVSAASGPVGIHPHQRDQSVFAIEEGRENGEMRLVGASQSGLTSTGRMVQGSEMGASLYREDGSRSPKGSTGSSSPHAMKQALMAQFQSTDSVTHLQVRGSETSSEAPPPYSSRPSSDAVLSAESSDPSTIDSRTSASQLRPWYQATSDVSLGSSGHLAPLSTKAGGDKIQPYAVLHSELAGQKSGEGKGKEAIIRRTNSQTKSSFQGKPPAQPYAEPVRSSVASLGHAQDSPTFFEVVV